MRKNISRDNFWNALRGAASLLLLLSVCAAVACAQSGTGSIDINARITPTGARPEPVRQFEIYILTKSYAEIAKEVAAQDLLPTRDEFISKLKLSPELIAWLEAHQIMDLTSPEMDKLVTPDDIIHVPEFFAAYQRSNSGGVTVGLPTTKAKEADKEDNPERYKKAEDEYMAATKKFIVSHPSTVSGIELKLGAVSPKYAWDKIRIDQHHRVSQLTPDVAQTKYLAAKTETDLDGHANVGGLPPGDYWVSTLGMDAASGDRRLSWNVATTVRAGQTARVNLSNVNGEDPNAAKRQGTDVPQ
jgi:hypothetical protein